MYLCVFVCLCVVMVLKGGGKEPCILAFMAQSRGKYADVYVLCCFFLLGFFKPFFFRDANRQVSAFL